MKIALTSAPSRQIRQFSRLSFRVWPSHWGEIPIFVKIIGSPERQKARCRPGTVLFGFLLAHRVGEIAVLVVPGDTLVGQLLAVGQLRVQPESQSLLGTQGGRQVEGHII